MEFDRTLTGTPRRGLIGATIGFFAGFAAMAVFGPVAHVFAKAMRLSPIEIGWLVSAPALSGSLLRIPFAAWADRVGARKPFLILLGLSLAAMVGLLAALEVLYPDRLGHGFYPWLFGLGVMSGCGIATFSVGASQVSYWHSAEQHGAALATYAGFGNMAPGLFSLFIPLALARGGLTEVYVDWLGFLTIGIAVYAATGRDAWYFQLTARGEAHDSARNHARSLGQEIFPASEFGGSIGRAAHEWQTWALIGLYFINFGGFLALTAWMPTYWRASFGASLAAAGALTAFFSLLASAVRVAAGPFSDRIGGGRLVSIALTILLCGSAIMMRAGGYATAIAGTTIVAIAIGIANAGIFKMVPQLVPHAVGGAAGLVGGLGALGGFVLPPMMAFAAMRSERGYAGAFAVFVVLAIGGLAIAAALHRTTSRAGLPIAQRRAA